MRRRVLCGVLAVFCASGCVFGRQGFFNFDGHTRAAFEMGCALEQLDIVEINSTTVGVAGCGQRIIYKQVTRRDRFDWVRD